MSDKIDFESNNLCSSEDAFENFVVVSMCEEKELLTLSCPAPADSITADSTKLKDATCDTEFEISSTVDDQLRIVNNKSKSHKDPKRSLGIISKKKKFRRPPARVKRKGNNAEINEKKETKKRKKNVMSDNNSKTNSKITQLSNTYIVTENISFDLKESEIRDSHVSTTQDALESVQKDSVEASVCQRSTIAVPKTYPGKGCRSKKLSSNINSKTCLTTISSENISHNKGKNKAKKPNNSIDNQIKTVKRRGRPRKTPIQVDHTVTSQSIESKIKTLQNNSVATDNVSSVEKLKLNKDSNQVSPLKLLNEAGEPLKKENTKDKAPEEKNSDALEVFMVLDSECLENNECSTKSKDKNRKSDDDETDDICLSMLKKTLPPSTDKVATFSVADEMLTDSLDLDVQKVDSNYNPKKRNSKKAIMTDFEYNIDSIIKESAENKSGEEDVNVVGNNQVAYGISESSSGRPLRRKGKQNLHYDEGSDEDPFAHVELSDDDGDPRRSKKGKRYFSDDEYIPGKKHGKLSSSDTTDSNIDKNEEGLKKTKRKKLVSMSGKKRRNKIEPEGLRGDTSQSTLTSDETCQQNENDVEIGLKSSVIKINDDHIGHTSKTWESCNELENFLAIKMQGTNLKIKKVSNAQPRAITPLEIPVIDPNKIKTVDICTQTNTIKTKAMSVQTTTPYETPMTVNVPLTAEQTEKACEFLKDIVKTTSELGELMTQKSDDFIKKKINIKHVTDTFKMDYCVKKSFLLFKLAKHNLMQMEADLSKQYEEFLKKNDLLQYSETPKRITPRVQLVDSDSDCEIIEEPSQIGLQKDINQNKPSTFNLKTLFLNKELSIKIAKKPNEESKIKDKIKLKGRKTMWISDSVLVKKVKPTVFFSPGQQQ